MKRRPERRIRSRPMDLQREVHPERLTRMLLVGMSVYTIAKKLNVSIGQSVITSKKNPSSQFFLRVKEGIVLPHWQSTYSEFYFCDAYWPEDRFPPGDPNFSAAPATIRAVATNPRTRRAERFLPRIGRSCAPSSRRSAVSRYVQLCELSPSLPPMCLLEARVADRHKYRAASSIDRTVH